MPRLTPLTYAALFTAALLPLVYRVTFTVLDGPFPMEIKSMVVGAVVSGVLGAMAGFWLGTSASSARKNEVAEAKGPVPPAPGS